MAAEMKTKSKAQDLWKKRTAPLTAAAGLRIPKPPQNPAAGPESPPSIQTPATPGVSPGRNPPSPGSKDQSSESFKRLFKAASRVSLFLASDDPFISSQNSKGAEESDQQEDGGSGRSTRKYLYTLAAFSMENRRFSNGQTKGGGPRRESGSGYNRLIEITGTIRRGSGEQRANTLGAVNKLTTIAGLMGLKHRAQARLKGAKCKTMWKKIRLWSRVIPVLIRLLRRHSASALTDPSSPFYSSEATETSSVPLEDLFGEPSNKDNDDMLFDPSRFKANTQRRVPQEAKRILTKPTEDRTPEEIHYVMIGMRNVPQVETYPVRMLQNLAQFGEFQCFEAKRRILRQGHRADGFYVILYGNVVVAVKNEETGFAKIVVELSRGETFGDIAIVSGGLRNSSVLTKTYTELLYVSKNVYENIFMTGGMKCINDPDHHDFISSLSFLRGWPLEKLSDKESEKYVRFVYIQRDGVIMRDSNFTDWLVVVKSGSVKVLKKLVRSKPTVSTRSGLYRHRSCVSAFQSFVTDAREYGRWLSSRGRTLPPPLHAEDDREEEEEDVEEEDVAEQREEELEFDEDTKGEEGLTSEEFNECYEKVRREHQQNERHHHSHHHHQQHEHQGHCNDHHHNQGHHHHHHNNHHSHHQNQQRPRERRKGVVHHFSEEERGKNNHSSVPRPPPRPHTWVKGDHPDSRAPRTRKAWSAKHPAPASALASSRNNRSAHLPKRSKLTTSKLRFDVRQSPHDLEQEIPQEIKFAMAKRTILDDMDAAFLSRAHPVTDADLHPQFVYVQTLTKGDVFGLASLVFPDQPGLCLVSNGAECMFIDKRFYMDNCPQLLSRRLKTEVSPYPSDSKLQEDLVNRINWDVYKRVVKRQVYEQSPSRVRVMPL